MLEDEKMSVIKVENVSFKYDNERPYVLKNISMEIPQGKVIAIVGHNGSGKSTLARLFNALLTPTKGKVFVDQLDVSEKQNLFEVRKRVGMVFQNPDNQIVSSIVEDDVAFGPENLGIKREEIAKRIDFALSAVGMTEFKKRAPTKLSGGQKQRIAIAGALAIQPDVLVLDESTAMLDPKGRDEVMDVVMKLNEENETTVVLITHYMEEVVQADEVYVMCNGEIIDKGTPAEIFSHEETVLKAGLDFPIATKIATALKEKGFAFQKPVLDKEQLLKELCK